MKEKFVTVKSSEGGGARYVEWVDGEPLLFQELKELKLLRSFSKMGRVVIVKMWKIVPSSSWINRKTLLMKKQTFGNT